MYTTKVSGGQISCFSGENWGRPTALNKPVVKFQNLVGDKSMYKRNPFPIDIELI